MAKRPTHQDHSRLAEIQRRKRAAAKRRKAQDDQAMRELAAEKDAADMRYYPDNASSDQEVHDRERTWD